MRIIYKDDNGGVCVVVPSTRRLDEMGDELTLTEKMDSIAQKDVPAGKSYKIVPVDDIPSDRTFRNAWTVNEAELTDGVGAESNEFPQEQQA